MYCCSCIVYSTHTHFVQPTTSDIPVFWDGQSQTKVVEELLKKDRNTRIVFSTGKIEQRILNGDKVVLNDCKDDNFLKQIRTSMRRPEDKPSEERCNPKRQALQSTSLEAQFSTMEMEWKQPVIRNAEDLSSIVNMPEKRPIKQTFWRLDKADVELYLWNRLWTQFSKVLEFSLVPRNSAVFETGTRASLNFCKSPPGSSTILKAVLPNTKSRDVATKKNAENFHIRLFRE